MIEHKLKRCAPDSPTRCQGNSHLGQCPFEAVEGQPYCARHGKSGEHREKLQKVRNYRLTQYQSRVNELADSDQVKSLREEIGILRMTLETIVNTCKTENDLIIYSNRITDMVIKIEKLVATCQRLEIATGEMMDKTKALQFASVIVNIIASYVTDVETVDAISNQIMLQLIGDQSETA